MTHPLYFVAFIKGGEAAALMDGPFVDYDQADKAARRRGDRYEVVEAQVEVTRFALPLTKEKL